MGNERLNIHLWCVCMWMCADAEGHAAINHTIDCNVLKLRKQWCVAYLYSGTRRKGFKKGVQCKRKEKKAKSLNQNLLPEHRIRSN